jgi:indoleamine 2,3-dioxygenase
MRTIQSQDSTTTPPSALASLAAYNAALSSLEQFRSEHLKIVALYVIGPARRRTAQTQNQRSEEVEVDESKMKGTGGSNLASLLKGMRTDTKESVLPRGD